MLLHTSGPAPIQALFSIVPSFGLKHLFIWHLRIISVRVLAKLNDLLLLWSGKHWPLHLVHSGAYFQDQSANAGTSWYIMGVTCAKD